MLVFDNKSDILKDTKYIIKKNFFKIFFIVETILI